MLAPEIARKLEDFGRRRRNLLLLRGVCEAFVAWVGGMAVLAVMDRMFIMEDVVRYGMSALAWGGAAYVFWQGCLKRLKNSVDPRRLAALVEAARPELREQLVSAVELADERGGPSWDSPIFRALVQEQVAKQVLPLDILSLLPRALVAKWVRGATALLAIILLLIAIPGLHFGTLLLRALAPLMNLERVSSVQIRVVDPSPADANVAQGDPVSVTVEVLGGDGPEVFLETIRTDGGGGKVKMQLIGRNRYAAEIPMRRDPVKYRVRAADGITKKYTLTAFARPQVKSFAKLYHFPVYVRRGDTNIVEPGGDLEALQGTKVKLTLTTDQAVSTNCQLRIDLGDKTNNIALKAVAPTSLEATVPMQQSGIYKVHLVAAATGFENKFSPEYEIRVTPDLLPSVTIDQPNHDGLALPDDKIELLGTAKDDLGLSAVDQLVQVNDGRWQQLPVATNIPESEAQVAQHWDLFTLNLKPGDRVTTKLVATDWKGSKGESTILRLLIGATGADAEERHRIIVERQVHAKLEKLKDAAEQMRKNVDQTAAEMQKPPEQGITPQQAAQKMAEEAKKVAEAAQAAQDEIKDALREIPKGQDAQDLVNLGRMVSRVERENVESAQAQLQRAAQMPDKDVAKQQVWNASEKLKQGVWPLQEAEGRHEKILASKEIAVAASDLDQLNREEQKTKEAVQAAGDNKELRDQLADRQTATEKQIDQVQDRLNTTAEEAKSARGWESKAIAQKLESVQREADKKKFARGDKDHLRDAVQKMAEGVERANNDAQNLAQNLAREADEARRALANNGSEMADQVERAHQLVRDSQYDKRELDNLEKRVKAAAAAEKMKSAAAELRDRAALEELRRDGDATFPRDLSQVAAALDAIRAQAPENATKPDEKNPIQDLAKAVRTLEANHDVALMASEVQDASHKEKWEKPSARELAAEAREFKLMNDRRGEVQNDLNRAEAPEIAKQDFAKALDSGDAQAARQEMEQRANNGQKNNALEKPLKQLGKDLAQVQKDLQPAVKAARDQVAALAPSLAERMKQMAKVAEEVQKKTEEVAKTPEAPPDVAQNQIEGQLQAQQQFNDNLEGLKADIRQDANAQDFASKEGRERARDADDALAMLKKPPAQAENALQKAAATPQPEARAEQLQKAENAEAKVTDALNQLAQHYENLDAGKPEETRVALRATEDEALKNKLDGEYAKAERLANAAAQDPQQAQAALQNELANDVAMRDELARIANAQLDTAAANLQKAVQGENAIAQNLQQPQQDQKAQLANDAGQQKDIQALTDAAAQNIEAAAKNEAMLAVPAEALQQVGAKTEATAAGEMHQAADALAQANQTAQAAPAVQAAGTAAQQRQAELAAARAQLPEAQQHMGPSEDADAAAAWLARALAAQVAAQPDEAARALAEASQQQHENMAAERQRQMTQHHSKHSGNDIYNGRAGAAGSGAVIAVANGDWGALPKQMARDLISAEHDGVSEEYRGQIDAYFKVLTAKARKK